MARGLKAQMKYADKNGAKFVVVIGDDEIDRGTVTVKRMETGETVEVAIDKIAEAVK